MLDEKRSDYRTHVFAGNICLLTQQKPRRDWSPAQAISHIGCLELMDRGATCIPVWLLDKEGLSTADVTRRANLTPTAQRYLDHLDLSAEDLFHHVLAVPHDPAYREINAGALRMEWPRIPLPGYPNGGDEGAAETLRRSAAHGREIAALLDPETPVPGVSQAPLRPEIARRIAAILMITTPHS